jgi:hypothetical protein
MNPILCLVRAYFRPGFPNPTTNFIVITLLIAGASGSGRRRRNRFATLCNIGGGFHFKRYLSCRVPEIPLSIGRWERKR